MLISRWIFFFVFFKCNDSFARLLDITCHVAVHLVSTHEIACHTYVFEPKLCKYDPNWRRLRREVQNLLNVKLSHFNPWVLFIMSFTKPWSFVMFYSESSNEMKTRTATIHNYYREIRKRTWYQGHSGARTRMRCRPAQYSSTEPCWCLGLVR